MKHRIMIYVLQDKGGNEIGWGFKPVKLDFYPHTKVYNRETGKMMICHGVYDIEEEDLPRLATGFRKLKRKKGRFSLGFRAGYLCNVAQILEQGMSNIHYWHPYVGIDGW